MVLVFRRKQIKTNRYTILSYNSIKFLNQCFFMTLETNAKMKNFERFRMPPSISIISQLISFQVCFFFSLLSVPHNKDSQKISLTFQSTFAATVFVCFATQQIITCPLAQVNGIYSKTFKENIDVLHILNLEVQRREIRMDCPAFSIGCSAFHLSETGGKKFIT